MNSWINTCVHYIHVLLQVAVENLRKLHTSLSVSSTFFRTVFNFAERRITCFNLSKNVLHCLGVTRTAGMVTALLKASLSKFVIPVTHEGGTNTSSIVAIAARSDA